MKIVFPENRYAGFIFDLDGTLIDSMPFHYRAWSETLESQGRISHLFEEKLFYRNAGRPSRDIIQWLNDRHGLDLPVEVIAQEKETRYFKLLSEVDFITPVVEVVRNLSAKAKLAVASGGKYHNVHSVLEFLDFLGPFSVILGSDQVEQGKPAPDLFLKAAELLDVNPQDCLVFEDGIPGMQAAKAAGMDWVDVRPHYLSQEKLAWMDDHLEI